MFYSQANAVCYYPLDSSQPLSSLLRHKTIIEFPTVYVLLPAPEQLQDFPLLPPSEYPQAADAAAAESSDSDSSDSDSGSSDSSSSDSDTSDSSGSNSDSSSGGSSSSPSDADVRMSTR